jgi:hypothetical protein
LQADQSTGHVQSAFVPFVTIRFFVSFVATSSSCLFVVNVRPSGQARLPPFVAAEFLAIFECVATA